MFRTIDELMYINDGHQPYQMLFIGRGGLGYTPTPYNMVGGMSMINPQFDEDDDENEIPPVLYGTQLKYDKETNNVLNTDNEWLKENIFKYFHENKEIEQKKKINKYNDDDEYNIFVENREKRNDEIIKKNILDEISRLDDIKYSSNNEDRYSNKKILDDIEMKKKELEGIYYSIFKDKYINEKEDVEKLFEDYSKKKSQSVNEGYKKIYDEAKKINEIHPEINPTYEKGNISEELIGTDRDLLYKVDGDYSTQHNSKDINAYTNDFKDFLETLWNDEEYKEKLEDKLKKEKNPIDISGWDFKDYEKYMLQFFPIDIIKKNTIWELKNHEKDITNTSEKQNYSTTKVEGYKPNKNNMVGYDIIYKNINGKNRLYNIRAYNSFNDKEVNTLPQNNKGYNFYTFFYNDKKAGYFNPLLKNNNFKFEDLKNPLVELELNFDNLFDGPFDDLKLKSNWKKEFNKLNDDDKKNFNVLYNQSKKYKEDLDDNLKLGKLKISSDYMGYKLPTKKIYTYPSQIINDKKLINKFERKIKEYKKKK